jgi:signal transduction histidine kinase
MATESMMAILQCNPHTSTPDAAETFSKLDVWGLRAGGLDATFARMREQFATQAHIQFRVIVQGTPRPLESLVRDEVWLIGHEALSNAFRHANASSIEVELEYAAKWVRVLVRDNGTGINAGTVVSAGGTCWGLWAMKERAKRIGGRLRILSRMAAGTEVELRVPAGIAFGTRDSSGVGWFSRLYS